jgi:hypothetical protein
MDKKENYTGKNVERPHYKDEFHKNLKNEWDRKKGKIDKMEQKVKKDFDEGKEKINEFFKKM